MRLADLLVAVAEVDGIERVRLSSIEINHLTDGLLEALRPPAGGAAPARADAVRRRWRAAGHAAPLRARPGSWPGCCGRGSGGRLNLTDRCDRRPPREDEAAFSNTLTAVRAAGFSKVHVFPYSPRPGTRDAGDDAVPAGRQADAARSACAELSELRVRATARPRSADWSACWWRPATGAATAMTTRRSSSRRAVGRGREAPRSVRQLRAGRARRRSYDDRRPRSSCGTR